MKIKGKFYLLANMGAVAEPHFIAAGLPGLDPKSVEVTTDPAKTQFFDTCEQAQVRQGEVETQLPYEVILCRARNDYLPTNKAKILRPAEA